MTLNVADLRALSRLSLLPVLLLLSCAPMLSMQPPIPMRPEASNEYGLAGGVSQAVSGDCVGCLPLAGLTNTGLVGQFWFRHRMDERYRVGVLVSAGNAYAFSAGFQGQMDLFEGEDLRISADVGCGLLWCSAGIPFAFQANPGLWLYGGGYGAITLSSDVKPMLRIPVGFAVNVNDRLQLLGEVSGVWRPTTPNQLGNQMWFLVAGVGAVARL